MGPIVRRHPPLAARPTVGRVTTPVLHRFEGHIAGIGTTSGTRLVVGCWDVSPLGSFADVMLERPDGHRVLLAPDEQVADFVASTYTFDEVRVGPVDVERGVTWRVRAADLDLSFVAGRRHPVAWALRAVPRPLRDRERWARTIDPVARRLMPGVRTHGSAGNGRTEWYAARDVRRLLRARAHWEGADLGGLAPVRPAVRFGFGSSPATPTLTRVRSFVRVP